MVPKKGDKVKFRKEFLDYHKNAFPESNLFFFEERSFTVKNVGGASSTEVFLDGFTFDGEHNSITIKGEDGTFGYFLGSPVVFELVERKTVSSAPRNNDGRAVCFWCPNTNTQKRGGGLYDVCPKCGK